MFRARVRFNQATKVAALHFAFMLLSFRFPLSPRCFFFRRLSSIFTLKTNNNVDEEFCNLWSDKTCWHEAAQKLAFCRWAEKDASKRLSTISSELLHLAGMINFAIWSRATCVHSRRVDSSAKQSCGTADDASEREFLAVTLAINSCQSKARQNIFLAKNLLRFAYKFNFVHNKEC